MRRRWRRSTGLLLAFAMLTAGAVGCGDDGDSSDDETGGDGASDSSAAEELTPVTVGILPIAGFVPFHYGVEEGIFEEEGLDVSLEEGQGGAALLPSVTSGEYQFAVSNYISLMAARESGVDVQVVSHIATGADAPTGGTSGLLVAPDSEIQSIEDMAGKTFAVGTVGNIGDVTVRATLRAHGVDDSEIRFQEVPPPVMNDAVTGGDVDVAWQVEPFLTMGESAGLVNVGDPIYETEPALPISGVFAEGSWLEENPEVAEAFVRAVQRSFDELTSDEEAFRAAIEQHTETPPPVVAEMRLGHWGGELDTDKLALVGELAAQFGILDTEPNLDELLWTL